MVGGFERLQSRYCMSTVLVGSRIRLQSTELAEHFAKVFGCNAFGR